MQLLVVDDSFIDRDIYRYTFNKSLQLPHQLLEAETGEAGLAYLGKPVDCVFIDYYLPDMDGLEFLSRWRETGDQSTPLVIVSGQRDERLKEQAMALGATDYVVKETHSGDYLKQLVQVVLQLM